MPLWLSALRSALRSGPPALARSLALPLLCSAAQRDPAQGAPGRTRRCALLLVAGYSPPAGTIRRRDRAEESAGSAPLLRSQTLREERKPRAALACGDRIDSTALPHSRAILISRLLSLSRSLR